MVKATVSDKGGATNVPLGMHSGVLVGFFDLGTHLNSFQGGPEYKVRLLYYVFEVEADVGGKPQRFFIGKNWNVSVGKDGDLFLGQKSKLREFLNGWRGRNYVGDEEIVFEKALAAKGQVNVVKEVRNGKTYSVVGGVFPLGKVPPIKPTCEAVNYSVDAGDPVPVLEWLPFLFGKPLQDWADNCLEWNGTGRREDLFRKGDDQRRKVGELAPADEGGVPEDGGPANDDDIPF